MEVKAILKNVRIGALKARQVSDLIRGKNVNKAIEELTYIDKKGAILIKKLLESAVANAVQKKVIDVDNLYVKTICVDQGPAIKRWVPKAQGRAAPIRKKLSHINLVLEER